MGNPFREKIYVYSKVKFLHPNSKIMSNNKAKTQNEDKEIEITNQLDLKEYSLPFLWRKKYQRRENGKKWDVYVYSPDGRRFRSNIEIEKFLKENPNIQCDRNLTKCKRPKHLSSPDSERKTKKAKLDESYEVSPCYVSLVRIVPEKFCVNKNHPQKIYEGKSEPK